MIRGWLQDFGVDARYAFRTFVLSDRPFAMTALLTLAVGIGAATAVFSVVNGVLLQPLPFPSPDRLVQLHGTSVRPPTTTSVGNLEAYRRESTSFAALAGYAVGARYMRNEIGAERVMVVQTEPEFFVALGVAPVSGRTYRPSDGASVVVISENFWRHRLGGVSGAVGRVLTLDRQPFTIVGIMPADFQFPYEAGSLLQGVASHSRTDLWMPFDGTLRPSARFSSAIGRLEPGVSVSAAQTEVNVISNRLERGESSRNEGRGVSVVPLARDVVPIPVRRLLLQMFGAVVIVLLLACANIANLSLARMAQRQREVAVRAAIGASPSRLVRQFLAEGILLALGGGLAGLLLAWWVLVRLLAIAAPYLPRGHEVGLDARVFVFTLASCALVAVAAGLAPALLGARRDGSTALHESGGRSTMSPAQRRLRNAIVVAEVALAFVLAVGAAALLRELLRLRATDAGIVREGVLTFHVGQRRTMGPAGAAAFYTMADRAAALPGVEAAGFSQMLPLQSWGWTSNSSDFNVRGRPPRSSEFAIELRYVTPGYFDALGIPIRRGRGFTASDTAGALGVIVINETLAARAFPGEDPIGLVTTRGTIAGTIGDVRQATLDRPPAPEIYYPIAQNWSQIADLGMTLVVRTRDRPEPLIDAVRRIILDVNPDQAVFGVKTMDAVVSDSLSGFTLALSVLLAFAFLAVVLAVSGTYGVISYIAASRSREFAIRVALGSGSARILRFVLRQGFVLTALGLALGCAAAVLSWPILTTAQLTVRQPDLGTLVPVACLIASVAAAASLIPARRAARADPMTLLRSE